MLLTGDYFVNSLHFFYPRGQHVIINELLIYDDDDNVDDDSNDHNKEYGLSNLIILLSVYTRMHI